MKKAKEVTTDGLEIIRRRYYAGRPEREAALEEERANAQAARKIHELQANR